MATFLSSNPEDPKSLPKTFPSKMKPTKKLLGIMTTKMVTTLRVATPSHVYVRLCKYRKHFLFLKCCFEGVSIHLRVTHDYVKNNNVALMMMCQFYFL